MKTIAITANLDIPEVFIGAPLLNLRGKEASF
jgi:hypothetical protein